MSTVECRDVSIRYRTGDFKSIGLKEYVVRKLKKNYHVQDFWADRHISFVLEKGDMLGIIGPNGAGKSTLLKAVSGVMEPAEGTIHTEGKIAALLELTSGFDPYMTVRDNIFLRGAMLGYTKKFITDRYEEILDFAELKEFEEYQFKQLSSGMKSRLAFSVACLVDPEIIILDEVLSVGDGAFREKSADKMREILRSGITGILVSHSVDQIRSLCNKVLWIDHGNQVIFSDEVKKCCDAYEESLKTKQVPQSYEEICAMAEAYAVRMEKQQQKAYKQEVKQVRKYMEEGSDAAVEAAVQVLRKHRPDLLKEDSK